MSFVFTEVGSKLVEIYLEVVTDLFTRKSWVPFYYSTFATCKVTQSFPILITFKPQIMTKT